MSELQLLTLTAPPRLEDTLVDWLLSTPGVKGFTSYAAAGHSSRTEGLTINEQVTGRTKQIRFEVHVSATDLASMRVALQHDFAGTGIHYWILPVVEAGAL